MKHTKRFPSSKVKGLTRAIMLSVLGRGYFPFIQMALDKPRIHFLCFHHIYDNEVDAFVKFLNWLQNSNHIIISYSEAIDRVIHGPIDKAYIAFSFDDGLHNCIKVSKLLQMYGVQACFFVNGKTIGENNPDILRIFCKERLAITPQKFMNWIDIESLLIEGHEIGDHTFSHPNLAQLTVEEIEEELFQNRRVLEKYVGHVKHFAWPYGQFKHFSEIARECVFKNGYVSCASAVRGAHVSVTKEPQFCIRRENIDASWPLHHIKFFLANSAATANVQTSLWNSSETN